MTHVPTGLDPAKNKIKIKKLKREMLKLHKKGQFPNILVYDIETSVQLAAVFAPGKQVVRSSQLIAPYNYNRILCICYKWFHEPDSVVKAITFDLKNFSSEQLIKDFDKILAKADMIIGKNNFRFDDKHINMHQLIHGLQVNPMWRQMSDDLEAQIRRNFWFTSYSLDYIADLFNMGGKDKMQMSDWIKIMWDRDKTSLIKMTNYCKKDVVLTDNLLTLFWPHVKMKLNLSKWNQDIRCRTCGTTDVKKNGTRKSGGTVKIMWQCANGHYAGQTTKQNPSVLGDPL